MTNTIIPNKTISEAPIPPSNTFSKPVRRMLWFNLHTWEEVMLVSLFAAAIAAIFVGVATYSVVRLTRASLHDTAAEYERYKLEAGQLISASDAKAEVARSDATKANERIATAEKETAVARLELEKLRATLAWRELSSHQMDVIAFKLKHRKFKVTLSWLSSDPEAVEFAGQLLSAMRKGGLEVQDLPMLAGSAIPSGLVVSGNNDSLDGTHLFEALKAAGLAPSIGSLQPVVHLFVGTKPRTK